jgi:SAM-dependent methyltransferase
MNVPSALQPDQQPDRWNDHVAVYEAVFEPLTNAFATHALDALRLRSGDEMIDIGAGSGGAAFLAAQRGVDVLAIDASQNMAARIRMRASESASGVGRGQVRAACMDGTALAVTDASFSAALSVFGIVLFPDAVLGMREAARVLRPGGRLAVVTWTEIEKYELAARLINAIAQVRGPQPPPPSLPAQLRFREQPVFRRLLEGAGLSVERIVRLEQQWTLPSAHWIADRIAFAPGMAAMIDGLGSDRRAVLDTFVTAIESDQGTGEIALTAVAHAGIAVKNP